MSPCHNLIILLVIVPNLCELICIPCPWPDVLLVLLPSHSPGCASSVLIRDTHAHALMCIVYEVIKVMIVRVLHSLMVEC